MCVLSNPHALWLHQVAIFAYISAYNLQCVPEDEPEVDPRCTQSPLKPLGTCLASILSVHLARQAKMEVNTYLRSVTISRSGSKSYVTVANCLFKVS